VREGEVGAVSVAGEILQNFSVVLELFLTCEFDVCMARNKF
jgi:hypothetical protein